MKKWIDLSQKIRSDMPVYPGTPPPEIIETSTITKDGFAEHRLAFHSHTGTHIDAPGHLLKDGKSLADFDVGHFCGSGCVLRFTKSGKIITVEEIQTFAGTIRECDYVLLHTGWSEHWGEQRYFTGYPVLTVDAARWLAEFNLKGIGTDTLSVDGPDDPLLANHHVFLGRGICIIENLTNLSLLPASGFTFSCFPIKTANSDGAPVRAVAEVLSKK